ncbi:hypothetical protein ScPMuIL_017474 [Solemya velum]
MSNVLSDISNLGSWAYNCLPSIIRTEVKEVERLVEVEMFAKGKHFVRIAGASGAFAVAMAAYGSHVFKNSEADQAMKEGFSNANHMHLIHSAALLAVPLTKRPVLVGTAMSLGIVLFSGTIYIHALTGSTKFRSLTPYGGMLLIFSWLAMIV